MERRDVLATAGVALGTPLVGCLGLSEGSDGENGTDGDDAETGDEDGDADRPDGGDDGIDPSIDARFHNDSDETRTFDVIVRDEDGDAVADDEIPVDPGGFEWLPAVGAAGETRTFEVTVDDTETSETLEFDADATAGERDGVVDVVYAGDGAIDVEFVPGDQVGVHDLYLANLDDESRRVDLEVVRRGAETPTIAGSYEIPGERGGEFEAVATWGDAYDVTVSLASGAEETFTWEIESCPGPEAGDDAAELPDGSRNGSVRAEPDGGGFSFVTDSCDEIVAGTDVPTGPAWQFEVDETERLDSTGR